MDLTKILFIALAICLCCALPGWCKLEKVRLKSVDITGSFWTELQKRNRDISVPHQYDMLKETRRLEALSGRWNGKEVLSPEEKEIAKKTGEPHYFWDSDVAKWIEAAAYVLAKERDPVLEKQVDDIVEGIEKTQRPDGYVNSYFVYVEPENRFRDLRAKHELYCAGHLREAAVAYYEATGKDRFLNCMRRYADHIGNVFGREKGRLRGYPGHEEIELALVRMYECTGKKDYLELADFFLTERGKQPCYFDLELGEDPKLSPPDKYYWAQAHMPVRRQREAVGHAVRAQYLYSGMTDVGRLKNDRSLLSASRALWKDVTEKKQYITGGVGSDPNTEGISITPYLLPNKTAYCEACASAAFIFWTRRLLAAGPRAEYADKIEKTLYNAL
ncbi:MAG: glycoside hydrolase family 127 protein, partial [Abditibacteriota bacterium]|nr:glycoside hydrolase family 127 protein [Abditibacteriota bacterium]